jgi:hypothetical protein
MRSLRAIRFVAIALVLSFAAMASAKADRVNYGSQTAANVTVFYFDLPANTQLFLRNWVSGLETAAAVPLVSGTGSIVVPFSVLPPGPGEYQVRARQAGGWVAETVIFYLFI